MSALTACDSYAIPRAQTQFFIVWERITKESPSQVEELIVETPGGTDTLVGLDVRYFSDLNENGIPEDAEVRFAIEKNAPKAVATLRLEGPTLQPEPNLKAVLIVTIAGGNKLYARWKL